MLHQNDRCRWMKPYQVARTPVDFGQEFDIDQCKANRMLERGASGLQSGDLLYRYEGKLPLDCINQAIGKTVGRRRYQQNSL